jgi:hypothetical protein
MNGIQLLNPASDKNCDNQMKNKFFFQFILAAGVDMRKLRFDNRLNDLVSLR